MKPSPDAIGRTDDVDPIDPPRLAVGLKFFGRTPGQALTKAEHDQLTAGYTRPLTQGGIGRHRKSGGNNEMGEYL